MHRFASLLYLAAAAACATPDAQEAPPTGPGGRPDVVGKPGAQPDRDPPPNDPPPDDPPAACLAVPSGGFSFGTSANEELRDVAITSTGSILAVGYDRASFSPHGLLGGRGIALEISRDLTATSQIGVLDSTGTDSLESIAIAPDTGRVWTVGRTNGELADMPGYGGVDWVIGELTSTGGLERLARGFESSSEYAHRLAVGRAGLLAIAGHEQAPTADGGSSMDPFLAVYDTGDGSASPIWFTSRRGPANESYRAVDISDTMVVAGGDILDGDEQGLYVSAWDRDAGRLWRRRLSDRGLDTVTAVRTLPDGNVLWAGSSASQLGAEAHGGLDAVVGVLDGVTGEPLWTMQYGGAEDDQVTDLAVDAHGRIAIVGHTQASAESGRTDVDAFLIVLDAAGGELLNELWTSDGDDRPSAVAMDPCGGIALVGFTTGDLAGIPAGGRDAFVLVTHVADPVAP